MDFLKLVSTLIGYLVVIGTAGAGVVKFGFWVYDEIQKRKQSTAQGYKIPPRTLTITVQQQREYWWHMGSTQHDPAMQIVGQFTITNVYSRPVRALQVKLRYGFLGRKAIIGDLVVSQHLNSNFYGEFEIPPNDTRNATFHIWLYPPVEKEHQTFVAHSVVVMDHFGNQHKVKGVKFEYR